MPPPRLSAPLRHANDAKATVTDPRMARRKVSPAGTAQRRVVVRPGATTEDASVALLRAKGVDARKIALGVVFSIPVLAPLPDVAVHVVQAPGVGPLQADRVGPAPGIGLGPGAGVQFGRVVAEAVSGPGAGTASVFPF